MNKAVVIGGSNGIGLAITINLIKRGYHVDNFPAEGSTIEKHVWISYNTFIRKLYEKSDFNANEPDVINRHWLLHGRSDYEQTELDCIRLFNAVQSLCMVVNQEAKRNETVTES